MKIFLLSIILLVAVPLGIFLILRREYRKYCAEMDRVDSMRKAVMTNENMTRSLLEKFDSEYGMGINGSISMNVRTKVEFSLNSIETLPLEDQVRESKRLFDMTYETWNRTRTNQDDVSLVTAPLNSFCRELARKKLNIIKKLAKEET